MGFLDSTAKGAAAGAGVGTVVPVVGNVLGAVIGGVVGTISGLFKKKKYVLWYWDSVQCAWIAAAQGTKKTLTAEAKKYTADKIKTTIVKPGVIPKKLSCAPAPGLGGSKDWFIAGGIAGVVLLVFVLIKKRR